MKYVSYYRVSTKKQETGLGLESQQLEIKKFISKLENATLIKEFEEVETGTNKRHRPILEDAIEYCKVNDATLLIAKLDRLARNVQFVSTLMNTKVKFKALDMPEADPFTIHIFAALAEKAARDISDKTKSGIEVIKNNLKVKGYHVSKSGNKITKLGGPRILTKEEREEGIKAIKNKAANNINNRLATPLILALMEQGKNYRQIAEELNKAGYKTSRGKKFSEIQVWRLAPKKNTPEEKKAYIEYLLKTKVNEELYKQFQTK